MKHSRITGYSVALGVCAVWAALWAPTSAFAAPDLFVGNFFGPGNEDVLRYNGTTGAFVGTFVPTGSGGLSFPLGGVSGPIATSMSAIPMLTTYSATMAPRELSSTFSQAAPEMLPGLPSGRTVTSMWRMPARQVRLP